jgi:hypothetical protein
MSTLGEQSGHNLNTCSYCNHSWDIDHTAKNPHLCYQCGLNTKTNINEGEVALKWWADKLDEVDLDEMNTEMPTSFNVEYFKTINNFSKRIKYCDQTLRRLGSGSARTVYMINDNIVLKLAKNTKGIQQNSVEAQYENEWYFDNIITKIYETTEDNQWVISEFAKKLTPNRFKELTDIDFKKFDQYLQLKYGQNNGRTVNDKDYLRFMTPEEIELFGKSEFVNSVLEFMFSSGSPAGDFGRLSSYGEVRRIDGEDRVVLVDYGLDDDVYNSYYRK